MDGEKTGSLSRRAFFRKSILAAGTAFAAPSLVPSSVFGKNSPGNRISMGFIGVGRMGLEDLKGFLQFDGVQVTAVCDADAWRLQNARNTVESHYRSRTGRSIVCDAYRDFREIIRRPDIDAVAIATPDHWHAIPAIGAAHAGKDIFLQKPLTYTIGEGRALSDAVSRHGRILQVCSQQRSDGRFRHAAELVRNGRIGKLSTVTAAFARDRFTGIRPVTAIPEELDYNLWLGPAPWEPYIEDRVHPVKSYERPGWMRSDPYCGGMITNWGAHHIDSAHWAMGMDDSGPCEIDGKAAFHREGIWDVHGPFRIEYLYPNGVILIVRHDELDREGIVFEGTDGWVHVARGFLDAHPRSLLEERFGPDDVRLYRSTNHFRNFLDCVKSRQEPVAPVEVGHRSCSACLLGWISMKLARKIKWDPAGEKILGDGEASRMLSRPNRSPWTSDL